MTFWATPCTPSQLTELNFNYYNRGKSFSNGMLAVCCETPTSPDTSFDFQSEMDDARGVCEPTIQQHQEEDEPPRHEEELAEYPILEIAGAAPTPWDPSEPLTEVLLNFTTNSNADVRKLSSALSHVGDAHARGGWPEQLEFPIDLLLDLVDVYGDSVWSRRDRALSALRGMIDGRAGLVGRTRPSRNRKETTWSVELFGAEESANNSIRNRLIAGGTHWPDVRDLAEAQAGGQVRRSVNVIRVENARHLWAYLGDNWEEWLETLNGWLRRHGPAKLSDENGYISPLKAKDVVLLKIGDKNCPYLSSFGIESARATITRTTESGADLFLVDYAMAIRQPLTSLIRLNDRCNLATIPSIVRHLKIEGVVAKPDVAVVALGLDFLSDVFGSGCWNFSDRISESTLQRLFEAVEKLCLSDDQRLRNSALVCAGVIPTEFDIDLHRSPEGFFPVVDLFLKTAKKLLMSKSKVAVDEFVLMMSTVRNLAFDSKRVRRYFVERKGLGTVLEAIRSQRFPSQVEMDLYKLVRVLFGPRPEFDNVDQYNKQPRRRDEDIILPKRSVRQLLGGVGRRGKETDLVDVIGSPAVDHGFVLSRAAVSTECLRQGDVLPIRGCGHPVLVLGIDEMVHPALAALLNSGLGGIIYVGVAADGTVDGVELTRKERDIWRLKFDQQLPCKLSPRPAPGTYSLSFVRVCRREQTSLPTKDVAFVQETLHVIRVHVPKPMTPHNCVYSISDRGECFLTFDCRVVKFSALQMRELQIYKMLRGYCSGNIPTVS